MMNATNHKNYDAFIQKLTRIVLQNLDNEQFGVSELAQNAGISRSQLHRKVKSAKNQSVSQFIRCIRLNEAVNLLQNEDLTVSEIAYRVGFSSPSYFHKCFHLHYQCAPGDYKKSIDLKKQNQTAAQESQPPELVKSIPGFFNLISEKKAVIAFTIIALTFTGIIYQFAFNSTNQKSIAVLPLHNFTGDSEDDFFVNGIHDGLIGTLGQISNLRVISRTSTLQYQAKDLPLNKIAKELGVDLIIEGSLSGTGKQKFLQLQLIEVFPRERHIWSKKYRQNLSDALMMEKNIARSILQQLEIAITPREESLLSHTYSINPEAYKAYIKGMVYWDELNEHGFNAAMDQFNLALEYDPGFAPAYAGKSLVWIGRLQEGLAKYDDVVEHVNAAANKALSLDSSLSEAYYTLGIASCWVKWNYLESEEELRKAVSINPNYSHARAYLSHVLTIIDQPEAAIEQMELALQLDPFNPLIQSLHGMILNFTRQYDKAIEIMEKTLQHEPDNSIALSTLRTTYHLKKMYPQALSIWKTSYRGDETAIEALEQGERDGGYPGALENLARLLVARNGTSYVTPWKIATLFTRAGKQEEAIKWLEKAYQVHDSNMPYIGVDPIFDDFHDNPRFQKLLLAMKLTEPGNFTASR